METRAHHVLIGLFVLLALLGAMAFGLWLSKSQDSNRVRFYQIAFNEAVRGLSIGSAVEYNGINVGDVVNLTLDPANPSRVLARVRIRGDIIVRQDTSAVLAMQGITGTSVIQLTGGSPNSPPLEAPDGEDPLIVARPSPVARILSQGENTFTNLNELLVSGKQVLSPENIANLQRTLANLEEVSGALVDQGGQVADMLTSVRAAATQASQTFQKMSALTGTVQSTLDGPATSIARKLNESATALASITAQTDNLLRDQSGAMRSGLQGLASIGPVLQELRDTLAALRSTIERLNEDPAGYLLDRNSLQEFKP